MQKDIYPGRSQVSAEVLNSRMPSEILVVPIDFAKGTHMAQVCSGTGQFAYKKAFSVRNTAAGARYLTKRIESCRRRFGVRPQNVLIGAEDPPEFALNFVHAFGGSQYRFLRVNARDAKRYRTNTRATSDTLVLNGIAQAILCRRSYDIAEMDELFHVMKSAERNRRRLVRQETAIKNRIHREVDVLFPGFLSESSTGLTPFGPASLDLMGNRFCATAIRRMRQDTLARRLRKGRAQSPEGSAAKLKELAGQALLCPPQAVPYHSHSLGVKVRLLRAVREALAAEECEMARCLAQTPGFYLTSIPGIGVVLGGGIVSEYGDPDNWPSANQMASYAGIVPRQYQSGGPDKPPVRGALPCDANHQLKDWLLQAAYHVGTTSHPAWRLLDLPGTDHPLRVHYQRVDIRDGRSLLSTAKALLRVCRAMVRDWRVYLPQNALNPDSTAAMAADDYVRYHQIVAECLARKWKKYDLSGIPDERNQLARWHEQTAALASHGSGKIAGGSCPAG